LTPKDKIYYTNFSLKLVRLDKMKIFDVPRVHCIGCGKNLELAHSINNKPPKPNDITVCVYCGSMMKFDRKMSLVKINRGELENIKKTALWGELIELQRELHKES
jgi:hypothetical protein